MENSYKQNYIDKLIEQKKRTIITRKEKIKELETFINEEHKTLELIDLLEKHIETLEKEKYNFDKKYAELERKYEVLSNKYKALSKSKLGKLTLKYWDVKRKDR